MKKLNKCFFIFHKWSEWSNGWIYNTRRCIKCKKQKARRPLNRPGGGRLMRWTKNILLILFSLPFFVMSAMAILSATMLWTDPAFNSVVGVFICIFIAPSSLAVALMIIIHGNWRNRL